MPRETETQIMRANKKLNSKLGRMIFKPGSFIEDLEEVEDSCDYDYEKPKLRNWTEAYCCEAGRLVLYGFGAWKAYEFLKTVNLSS